MKWYEMCTSSLFARIWSSDWSSTPLASIGSTRRSSCDWDNNWPTCALANWAVEASRSLAKSSELCQALSHHVKPFLCWTLSTQVYPAPYPFTTVKSSRIREIVWMSALSFWFSVLQGARSPQPQVLQIRNWPKPPRARAEYNEYICQSFVSFSTQLYGTSFEEMLACWISFRRASPSGRL